MAHHLVLGELRDVITGQTIPDTHDERIRQRIARWLLEEKGFRRQQLTPRRCFEVRSEKHRQTVVIDWVVALRDRNVMLIRYGPGSLVSRQRPALAAARLLEPYVVPLAVITNGRNAHILEVDTGKLRAEGLANIPSHDELSAELNRYEFSSLDSGRAAAERRILIAFEALDCEC